MNNISKDTRFARDPKEWMVYDNRTGLLAFHSRDEKLARTFHNNNPGFVLVWPESALYVRGGPNDDRKYPH